MTPRFPPRGLRRPADERAVSDVVGYVLVFALITATLGTVFAVGFVGLEDRQHAERVENVERAFDVLDDNLRDVQRHEDPSRSTEVRLSGGTLSLVDETTMTVKYANGSGDVENRSFTTSTLAYTSGDTTIAYEGGAWFRADGDGATMRSPPRFVAEDGRTVLPVVRLLPGRATDPIQTDGTVQITTERGGDRTFEYPADGPSTDVEIRLRVESPYADAWAEHLDRADGFDVDADRSTEAETVAVLDHDETVYVHTIGVDVSLRR